MRKRQQHQILEIIKTLSEAQAAQLYTDCQEGALQIGEYIESVEGEGTQTVVLLEKYHELCYKVSIGESSAKALKRALIQIESSIRSELKPNKIEVVFISYNAAMADSMESIYLAAIADSDCDAYFIPVPYYDRNTDRTLGMRHYESSDCYSEDIKITDYREYDITTRQPDIIFTNNPYDDINFVTCVHADYFTRVMKQYTDMLCYVPYYLPETLNGEVDKNFVSIAASKPFDLVVAMSESNKQCHLSIAPKMNIVALGSPKLDRLILAMQSKSVIPFAWLSKIPDIEQKKIIFLGSSIRHMLKYNNAYIDRMNEYITAIESHNDVVLIFRPHPLTDATLKSMLPALRARYASLVARVEKSAFGIFDISTDFIPSIIHSNAYVGELESSLARMYTLTGKPIFATVIDRSDTRDELRGGDLIFDYPETKEFTLDMFLDKLISGEIAAYDEKQVAYQSSIYINCDGTSGQKIYEYVRNKILNNGA